MSPRAFLNDLSKQIARSRIGACAEKHVPISQTEIIMYTHTYKMKKERVHIRTNSPKAAKSELARDRDRENRNAPTALRHEF